MSPKRSAADVVFFRHPWLWLDQRGWFSTWEHSMFELRHYGPLRDRGLSHKEAIVELEHQWKARA